MSRSRYQFTRATLDKLKRLKELDPALSKKEACSLINVSLVTLNRAADKAGLREELTALFPSCASGRPIHTHSHQKRTLICMRSTAVRWLSGNWRAQA